MGKIMFSLTLVVSVLAFQVGARADQITEARYNETVSLPNCGGTLQTVCSDESRCFLNISGTSCKGVRLYDDITYKYYDQSGEWGKFFAPGRYTRYADLVSDGWNTSTYSSSYGQFHLNRNHFNPSLAGRFIYGSDYSYFVTLFVYRTDRDTPYDKVILWFHDVPQH